MNHKQKIIFKDLTKHFKDRLCEVADDFIERCNESDMPDSEIRFVIANSCMRMAILIMENSGFSPEAIAKYVYEGAKNSAEKS